jgi:DNA polymerase III subunit epsilon
MRSNKFVILDTETTGLGNDAEMCQIGIVDFVGDTLLDTLVRPSAPIPAEATFIHGITDDMVKDAPTWMHIWPTVADLIKGKDVIIYNADYDMRIIRQSHSAWGLSAPIFDADGDTHCAMLWYAEYWGEWNDYRQSFRWQKLSVACQQQKVAVKDAHSAIGDCKMTYALLKRILSQLAAEQIEVISTGPTECEHIARTRDTAGNIVCADCGQHIYPV